VESTISRIKRHSTSRQYDHPCAGIDPILRDLTFSGAALQQCLPCQQRIVLSAAFALDQEYTSVLLLLT